MNLIGPILILTLNVLSIWHSDQQNQSTYTVTLEETSCAPTRRLRCGYHFVEVSSENESRDNRHFRILFYIGADQAEGKEDAISRLDRFFRIVQEGSSNPGVENTRTVGYKKPVTLRIEGSKYEFNREDGEKIVVDIEKKTRP